MRRWVVCALVLLSCLAGIGAQEPEALDNGPVYICRLDGMIDEGLSVLVDRAVREANEAAARGLIFVIDTPGGLLDAAITITKTIADAECPTIAYIEGMGAISAGALISFSCDHIVMAPGTAIGAATPILMSAEGPMPTSEKEVSFMRATMRTVAEANGHNPDIAQAMVDKDLELWGEVVDGKWRIVATNAGQTETTQDEDSRVRETLDVIFDVLKDKGVLTGVEEETPEVAGPAVAAASGEIILPAGKLLTMTTSEAEKYGVIETRANNIDEILSFYDMTGAEKVYVEMTWSERLFRFLTNPSVAGILLMIALAGLYIEIKTPGFGLPGLVAIAAFTLFFGAHAIIGMAEWIDLALVIVGAILIVVEIFVLPGFGLAGVSGIVCLLLGVYLSLTNFTIPEYSWQFARLEDAAYSMVLAGALGAVAIYLLYLILPKTPLYREVVLATSQQKDEGWVVQQASQVAEAIGQKGVALTMLRPAGKGRFGDKTYHVVSRAEYLPLGTAIEIVQVDGNRYVVDKTGEGSEEIKKA